MRSGVSTKTISRPASSHHSKAARGAPRRSRTPRFYNRFERDGRPPDLRPTIRRRRAAPHGARARRISTTASNEMVGRQNFEPPFEGGARRPAALARAAFLQPFRTRWSAGRTSSHHSKAARGAPRRSRAPHFYNRFERDGRRAELRATIRRRRAAPRGARARRISTTVSNEMVGGQNFEPPFEGGARRPAALARAAFLQPFRTRWSAGRTSSHHSKAARGAPRRSRAPHFYN